MEVSISASSEWPADKLSIIIFVFISSISYIYGQYESIIFFIAGGWHLEQIQEMKKDYFILELIKSVPVRILIFIVMLIFMIMYIHKCNEKKVQMKEDVLYVQPKPKVWVISLLCYKL